jgi:hypothetical protein
MSTCPFNGLGRTAISGQKASGLLKTILINHPVFREPLPFFLRLFAIAAFLSRLICFVHEFFSFTLSGVMK